MSAIKKITVLVVFFSSVFSYAQITTTTGTVTDIDGNVYQTIKIGNQWWMAENLKVTHYRNGDSIKYITDKKEWANIPWKGLTTAAYCNYVIFNLPDIANTCGFLYNWYAVDDPRGLAPDGWHVPSDDDWKELEVYLGMSHSEADSVSCRGTNEGAKLKQGKNWRDQNISTTYESGFAALPCGLRFTFGEFDNFGTNAHFWTSTRVNKLNAWSRSLDTFYKSEVCRSTLNGGFGLSVRCVKD